MPGLRTTHALDAVIANAENASGGSGLAPAIYKQLRAAGIDAITLGDHIYKKFDLADILNDPAQPIVKPANYPAAAAGRDHCIININNVPVAVISIMGRTFMRPVDCPYAAVDRVLASLRSGYQNDHRRHPCRGDGGQIPDAAPSAGRVSAVLGTHTHVPTADEHILKGTAFQCDVGMCGPYASVLGRQVEKVLAVANTFEPMPFDVATEDVRLSGPSLKSIRMAKQHHYTLCSQIVGEVG